MYEGFLSHLLNDSASFQDHYGRFPDSNPRQSGTHFHIATTFVFKDLHTKLPLPPSVSSIIARAYLVWHIGRIYMKEPINLSSTSTGC